MEKNGRKDRTSAKPVPEPRADERRQPEPLDQLRRQLGWDLAAVARQHGRDRSR